MIKISGLTRSYGGIRALAGIDLEIGKGEIVGILGRNGAGKTTLMRILTTYLEPTSGTATVAGHDIIRDPLEVRRNIGYLPENPPLYPFMTVREYLRFAGSIKEIPARKLKERVEKVLAECDIANAGERVIANLSKGYKQRVGIAQALMNDPPVLFLDEPTNGLDPVQIVHIRKLIRRVERDHTVVISTHILSEVAQMADRVLIMRSGKIAADESLKDAKDSGTCTGYLEDLFLKTHEQEMRTET